MRSMPSPASVTNMVAEVIYEFGQEEIEESTSEALQR